MERITASFQEFAVQLKLLKFDFDKNTLEKIFKMLIRESFTLTVFDNSGEVFQLMTDIDEKRQPEYITEALGIKLRTHLNETLWFSSTETLGVKTQYVRIWDRKYWLLEKKYLANTEYCFNEKKREKWKKKLEESLKFCKKWKITGYREAEKTMKKFLQ